MKKETIFKHELNESIQANAAMNCLKNRNNHKQLNESSDFDKMMGVREDEETVDYAQLADDVCASYRGTLSKLDLKGRINYIIKMVAKKIGKTVDALTPQELTAIQKAAKHSVWYVSEQEELSVEQEELPQMERHDMILALSEYMSESWIDTGDDGDLDDIYYAIAAILDETGDYPASTSWEDCKPWCQKHYKEVEARIYPYTTKVTVRTPMGMKQMNLSTEVFEAFVKQTGSHDFSDRSAVRVIAGIVKELTKKGYSPTEDEQKIVDIQNKKIKQGMASRNAATDRSMNALSD